MATELFETLNNHDERVIRDVANEWQRQGLISSINDEMDPNDFTMDQVRQMRSIYMRLKNPRPENDIEVILHPDLNDDLPPPPF